MKLKILSIFLLTIFYFLNLNNCQTLNPIENAALIDLVYQLHNTNITKPCSEYGNYFTCENDGTEGGSSLTVTSIYLNVNPFTKPLYTDFSIFKNLTSLRLYSSVETQQNIFDILPSLVKLTNLAIYNQSLPIRNDLVLPPLLTSIYIYTLGTPLVPSLFTTGILEILNINYVLEGFKYPASFPSNNHLKEFYTCITSYSSDFPSNAGSSLTALNVLQLKIFNDLAFNGYSNYSFPTFQPFENLKDLVFYFSNEIEVQTWQFPTSILSSKNIERLMIHGRGFTNTGLIDFSIFKPGFQVLFQYGSCEVFTECSGPCLKFPKKSHLTINYCGVDISKTLDFTNITFIDINTLNEQPLPVDTIDFPNVNLFSLHGGHFTGTIPAEYCQFPYNVIEIGYNDLSGDVPSCFTCFPSTEFSIFPNSFDNYNDNSNDTDCPSFSIDDNYDKIAKTDGSTVITIKGTDFGWTFSSEKPQPPALLSDFAPIGPSIKYLISNTEFSLSIPKGDGANKTFTGFFGYDGLIQYQFYYRYETPVITSYQFVDILGDSVLVLKGTGFSFVNQNSISINGILYDCNFDENYNGVVVTQNPTESLSTGDPFTVFATVGGQESNTITFYLYSSISLTKPTTTLKSTGGSIDLAGLFLTNDKTHVTVTINSISCTVVSATPSKITINYPPLSAGIYELILNIGGNQVTSQVQYVLYVPIPSPTPTNSDGSEPSSSSKLFVSFISLSLLLSLISLIL